MRHWPPGFSRAVFVLEQKRIMASIKLPDGSIRDVSDGTTVGQLAESIGRGLARAAIVGRVDGRLVDLSHPLTGSHEVAIVTDRDPDGLYVMRHSTAHVLAQALRHLYGANVQYTIGPVIENGFFYDFEFPKGVSFSAEDLPKVEAEMQRIVQADLRFSREDVEPPKAKEILHEQSQRFKDEIIDELACAGEKSVSIYRQGDFTDLCRGPHVPSTGKIKAFKLQSVAGAYWRGDSNREQLTRVYGTAFFDKKQLDDYLKQLEEAKQRDHRLIGQKLGLFAIDEQVGPGLILWKPKGAAVRMQLQQFLTEELFRRQYEMVFTPNIGKLDLYRTSGHYPYYEESQFPVMMFPRDEAYDLLKATRGVEGRGQGPRPGAGAGAGRQGGDRRQGLPVGRGRPDPAVRHRAAALPHRRGIPAQADELPAPHQDLFERAAELPGFADPAGGVRHRLPQREDRRAERPDPRPRIHAG